MGGEVAYRDNRGRWTLKIFWSSFVKARTEFALFKWLGLLNLGSTLGQLVLSWRNMGSEMTRGLVWFVMLLTGVFLVGIVVALIRSSMSDARDVEGVEAKASLETLSARIATGELDERTLVDLGRGWESAGECYEFEDAVLALKKKRSMRRMLTIASVLALLGGGVWLAVR